MKHDRNSVDRIGIYRFKDRVGRDAAKEADLLPEIRPHWILRTADDDVGLYADTAQLVNAVLSRFGLELSRGRYIWNERNVAVKNILPADTPRKLTYRLKIWKSLNIAYRAADLGNDDIITGADMLDPVLYFIRDMRYDLHCCAVIASRAFALYYGGINLAGGTAVLSQDRLVYETLIMPEVKIRLRAVTGHKDLSMLEWAHRPRIDVDIGIHLYDAHPVTAALQQYTERRGGDPFSKRRNYPAGDKIYLVIEFKTPLYAYLKFINICPVYLRCLSGFCGVPLTRTSKCTWFPVERPVLPTRAIVCPWETLMPFRAISLLQWP